MRPASKLVIGGAIILTAVGYLGFTGLKAGWVYYVDVDQFLAQPALEGRRARVFGVVGDDGVEVNRAGLSARFQLTGTASRLAVDYRGAIPELFQAGRQVVIEGQLDPDGVFHADVLLTKCSSKYEGQARHPQTAGTGP